MGDIRVSQDVVETVSVQGPAPALRVSQHVVEVVSHVPGLLTASVNDAITTSSSVTRAYQATLSRSVNDAVTVTESRTAQLNAIRLSRSVNDAITVAESRTVHLVSGPLTVEAAAEGVTVTDAVVTSIGERLIVQVADAATVADTRTVTLVNVRVSTLAADSVAVADARTVLLPAGPINKTITHAVSVTTFAKAAFSTAIRVVDRVAVTDLLSEPDVSKLTVFAVDGIGVVESKFYTTSTLLPDGSSSGEVGPAPPPLLNRADYWTVGV